jgi:signal recognition particle receptor subunit alpha
MIEQFTIFTKGGVVLWQKIFSSVRGQPINDLIRKVLLQERSGENLYSDDRYVLKWNYANEHDLVFVVVYEKNIPVTYAESLLESVKTAFCQRFGSNLKYSTSYAVFDKQFTELHEQIESKFMEKKSQPQKPRDFWETKKGQELLKEAKNQKKNPSKTIPKKEQIQQQQQTKDGGEGYMESESTADDVPEKSMPSSTQNVKNTFSNQSQETKSNALPSEKKQTASTEDIEQKLARLGVTKRGERTPKKEKSKPKTAPPKKGKVARKWDEPQLSKEELDKLDFSQKGKETANNSEAPVTKDYGQHKKISLEYSDDESNSDENAQTDETEEDETSATVTKGANKGSGLLSFFKVFTNKTLTREDLQPALEKFKEHLVTKNVATEIAEKLCESVASTLVGKQLGSFTRVSTTVRTAMEEALTHILTPRRRIDIIREVRQAQQEQRPYSIVFVGVNGVGKSTSLAKVCSWLQQNGFKVMIAACDTFRSGAIEQLQVHARNLGVELYSQGYGKDPAAIAAAALSQAKKNGTDVVLIDTAGRMQDNEPLMKALSKLVSLNKPDLVLFVGEALVGNDSVDQMRKFNRALEDYAVDSRTPRSIDGIILTKFDTVDDKVGAAISMVYTTGQPIVFVGVGQHYTDLKTLNVKRIVQILIKGRV